METTDTHSRLDFILKSLNKKKNTYILLKGLSIIALLLFISVGIASIFSLFSSNTYYYAILKIFVLAILTFAMIKELVLPLFSISRTNGIIGELDRVSKGLGEDTLSAIELKENIEYDGLLGMSKELAMAHIERTSQKLGSLSLSNIYPLRNLKKNLFLTCVSLIFVSLTMILIPGSFKNYLFSLNLLAPENDGRLELANIEININYPDYTNLPSEKVESTNAEIKVLRGSVVEFEAEVVSPFDRGSLIVKNSISVPVKINGRKISAQFTALGNGSFVIKESSRNMVSETFELQVTADNEPIVKISSPLGDSVELGSEEKMDIFYEAEDDFNISKLVLSWENQRDQSEIPIKISAPNSKLEGKLAWGPSAITPGDYNTIKLRVLAYDNDTISGPNVGVSNVITVKLKDAKSKHKETMNFAEQLMEELIDILADEINLSTTNTDIPDNNKTLKEQKQLTRKIEHAKGTLALTISSMKDDEFSDFTNFVALSNMEVRISALVDERKHLIESFANLDSMKLSNLMEREIIEFEDDILFLDSLIKGDKLLDSLLSSKNLLNEYSELSELLKQLGEGSDEEIAKEIQKKLDQIKNLMSQLADKMKGLSGEIQEGFLNKDAFEATNMGDQLDQISKLAQEGKIDEALEMLSDMAQSLQSMMASIENGMQSFGSSTMSQGMSKLNDLTSKIEKIERDETQLRDNTVELKSSILDTSRDDNNIREFVDDQVKKTQQLSDSLKEAKAKMLQEPPSQSNPQSDYLVDKMIERTKQLENWIKAMDFNEAQKSAKTIQESTQGLKDMSRNNFANFGKISQELANANKLSDEIKRGLDRQNEITADGGEAEQLAGRQDEIKDETRNLINELSEIGAGLFLPPRIKDNLGLAENFMQNASSDLNSEQISKAISNEEEALEALRAAKDEAKKMMQQMQMSSKGKGMSAPMMIGRGMNPGGNQGVDNRYVEIPQVDESLVGKEYKQKILEAMKGGSPQGFIELNKKYYDRIIK